MRWLILIVLFLSACSEQKTGTESPPDLPDWIPTVNVKPQYFESCQSIRDWAYTRQLQFQQTQAAYQAWLASQDSVSASSVASSSGSGPTPNTGTNIQVEGVDEPDMVKLSDKYLFTARTRTVEITDRKTWKPVQTLEFPLASKLEILWTGKNLAVIETRFENYRDHNYSITFYQPGKTRFTKQAAKEFKGRLVDARLYGRHVILVATSGKPQIDETDFSDGNFLGVPCASVQMPIINDYNFQVVNLHRIDINEPSAVQSAAKVGGVDQIYATAENVYTIASGYDWYYWDPRIAQDSLAQAQIVSKFTWNEECGPRYVASGIVDGAIRNSWAFHERGIDHRLFIATTYVTQGAQHNRVWAFDQDEDELVITGKSELFGRREDIRSVRYAGDKAYVVTFEKTDPLFVFDLRGADPRIESELKVPGFSAYLHPVKGGHLLGVGYAAAADTGFSWLQGVQLSLFDVSNPQGVRARAQKEFGGRMSHADTSDDHHAFFYDHESGVAAIPVRLLEVTATPWNSTNKLEFSGALVLKPGENLEPVAKLTHWQWIPADCQARQSHGVWWNGAPPSTDIRRVLRAGSDLISVSNFAVMVHDGRTFATKTQIAFADAAKECSQFPGYRLW